MKVKYLGSSVKWQKTDPRNVIDLRQKVIKDFSFPSKSGLILEIGCAAGNFFNVISDFNFNYVGVDLDKKQIERARRRFPNGKFIYGDILKMDYLFEECKTIVSFQVFEHIKEDLKLFDKIKVGTDMIFSVPNFPYRGAFPDGHKRYYELDGWVKRYGSMIEFLEAWVIKHYKKERRIFVFQGVKK